MKINAGERDFETVLINAFRYAMPRFMTTAFDPVERMVYDNMDLIHTWVLKQWLDDIDAERRIWEHVKNKPGILSMDNPSVRDEFYNNIKAEIQEREKNEQHKNGQRRI